MLKTTKPFDEVMEALKQVEYYATNPPSPAFRNAIEEAHVALANLERLIREIERDLTDAEDILNNVLA